MLYALYIIHKHFKVTLSYKLLQGHCEWSNVAHLQLQLAYSNYVPGIDKTFWTAATVLLSPLHTIWRRCSGVLCAGRLVPFRVLGDGSRMSRTITNEPLLAQLPEREGNVRRGVIHAMRTAAPNTLSTLRRRGGSAEWCILSPCSFGLSACISGTFSSHDLPCVIIRSTCCWW